MGIFGGQLSNVVEWEEYRDDIIFWKWDNKEIKKGSKLIIRQGQDAIFMYNGKVEGIFTDEGRFDMETQIIPFLSTLAGFRFGFNSGVRAEVLFINTKEFTINWGTKNAINIPAQGLPGGMPIRAFGNFNCKVTDHSALIDKIAGVKKQFSVDDIRERVVAVLNQLLMKWIMKRGRDMFHLQADAYEISKGIMEDLDMEMCKIGIGITGFAIESFSYPDEIQKMAEKAASQSMMGDMGKYTQFAMADSMGKGQGNGSTIAGDMMNMQMGMMMGQQMMNQMNQVFAELDKVQQDLQENGTGTWKSSSTTTYHNSTQSDQEIPNFCPNCGAKTSGANFCSNCGTKLN
ncbi:SPFH domain-containing protein [Konateibacter massiliensis]|uniref:SPFH domain-containing protein n=1 Tax=Konateibacter massiliensis TaxID=2002841 RepID=UPI000C14CE5E|nr:SPFH domain-containing protein [Konateibacter massiliensis]